jgi:acetolactate synthase-1/2/3 large subunit
MGEGPTTGVTTPDMVALAQAYGIPARRVTSHVALPAAIAATLAAPGPALCDVVMDPEGVFAPKAMAGRLPDGRLVSRPLEDLHPFLERDELADNMIVAPYEPERG